MIKYDDFGQFQTHRELEAIAAKLQRFAKSDTIKKVDNA